jgi:PAS domain S-box-containing protein/diguanylate cyclase (GGDEF)-like protein
MSDRGAGSSKDEARGDTDVAHGSTVDAVRRILDAAAVPTATLDGEGQIVSLNPAFARLCGRAPSEIAGLHLLALCPGRDQAEALSKLVRIVGAVSDIEQEELRVTGADGRVRTLSLTLGGLTGADGRVDRVIAIATDLTEERRAQRRRRRESVERAQETVADGETGLPNQRALPVLIGSAVRRAASHEAPFALLRCEVTNLDAIEARHGATTTRNAMTALAERLTQRLRSADTVTRSDPSAFTVIAEDLGDPQDAAGVAYRLLASVVEDVLVDGAEVAIDMVIGIAVGDGTSTPERLLTDAATATAEARTDGVGGFRMIDARTASPA